VHEDSAGSAALVDESDASLEVRGNVLCRHVVHLDMAVLEILTRNVECILIPKRKREKEEFK
jgi:hypothetical protein